MSSLLSGELEDELGVPGASEYEDQLNAELEQELEAELEAADELLPEQAQEGEHEAYFNSLAAMADRKGRSQALRRVALAAARAALRGKLGTEPPIEGELELESLPALEFELGPACELPGQMEHLGHAAAGAASEQEAAEHFLPLIGLAAKFVLPKVAGLVARKVGGKLLGRMAGKFVTKAGGRLAGRIGGALTKRLTRAAGRRLAGQVRRAVPQLTRGVANVARTLWRHPATRPLLRAVPQIARGTVVQLARQYAAGRPIDSRTALRVLARNTARTLSHPHHLARIYRRSARWDRHFHHRNRRVIGRPGPGPFPGVPPPPPPPPMAVPPGVSPGSVVVTPGYLYNGPYGAGAGPAMMPSPAAWPAYGQCCQ